MRHAICPTADPCRRPAARPRPPTHTQAYSMHNVRVGYCRAMNNVVSMMLVALNRNEESAFWLLAALVEDILFPGTYAHNLEGCQVRAIPYHNRTHMQAHPQGGGNRV